jgi:hypothetical protein
MGGEGKGWGDVGFLGGLFDHVVKQAQARRLASGNHVVKLAGLDGFALCPAANPQQGLPGFAAPAVDVDAIGLEAEKGHRAAVNLEQFGGRPQGFAGVELVAQAADMAFGGEVLGDLGQGFGSFLWRIKAGLQGHRHPAQRKDVRIGA